MIHLILGFGEQTHVRLCAESLQESRESHTRFARGAMEEWRVIQPKRLKGPRTGQRRPLLRPAWRVIRSSGVPGVRRNVLVWHFSSVACPDANAGQYLNTLRYPCPP